jgi:hypothetical protein
MNNPGNLDMFCIYVFGWFVFTAVVLSICKQKGYARWPVYLTCVLLPIGMFLLSLQKHGTEIIGPIVWLLPLLIATAAFLLPSRR